MIIASRTSFLRTALCAVMLHGASVAASAAPPVRVAVIGPEAPESTARLTAEISKIAGVEMVAREQIKILLGEQSLGASGRERLALGRRLSADLLLLVGPKGDSFAYVDAHTGEELFRIREVSLDALALSAFLLVEELRDARKTVSVTVLDDPETREAADVSRAWLRGQDVRVLDRIVSQEAQKDPTSIDPGQREQSNPPPGDPGADVLLKVLATDGKFHLEVRFGEGALWGVSPPWNGNDLPPDVQAFVEPFLKPRELQTPSVHSHQHP